MRWSGELIIRARLRSSGGQDKDRGFQLSDSQLVKGLKMRHKFNLSPFLGSLLNRISIFDHESAYHIPVQPEFYSIVKSLWSALSSIEAYLICSLKGRAKQTFSSPFMRL